ncbi:hypothetical protein [Streptomyces zaomyceticus]|uniref:hypothetical protein n=1 Tax=Streptomyces zaomyceticus TaxID=68286 RepID=UPI002E1BA9F0
MTTVTPLPNALVAATRARAFAAAARRLDRPAVAAALDAAALDFETDTPGTLDGVTITNTIPSGAYLALWDAETEIEDNPVSGLPCNFAGYIRQAIYRTWPEEPAPLNPGSATLAAQETGLRARLAVVRDGLDAARHPGDVAALVDCLVTLHRKLADLADAVTADHARPDVQSATAAEPFALDLAGCTAYTAAILRTAHAKGLRPTWGQDRGNARRIVLNAPGPNGAFGSIQIGKRTGKVLRAEVIPGNDRAAIHATGTNAVRTLIASLPTHP